MTLRLYSELASWWPLLSSPEEYAEEAGIYMDAIDGSTRRDVHTLLELGSGGGNNASHMKKRFKLTLVDVSPDMLNVSRRLNPECDHLEGDMRTIRLGRRFDAVFIHDAIMYMRTERDLAAAVGTAAEHLESGGVALFAPDETTENYRPRTDHGGHDGDGRSLRYLEWSGPIRDDDTVEVLMAYVMREGERLQIEHDLWTYGLFPRATWIRVIEGAGLEARALPYPHSDFDVPHELFIGLKP